MSNNNGVVIDVATIDKVLAMRNSMLRDLMSVTTQYDRVTAALLKEWKGKGAAAFKKDAESLRVNFASLYDLAKSMFDTLEDVREIYIECDADLAEYCRAQIPSVE